MNLWAEVLTVHVKEVHDVMDTIEIFSRDIKVSAVWYSPSMGYQFALHPDNVGYAFGHPAGLSDAPYMRVVSHKPVKSYILFL